MEDEDSENSEPDMDDLLNDFQEEVLGNAWYVFWIRFPWNLDLPRVLLDKTDGSINCT